METVGWEELNEGDTQAEGVTATLPPGAISVSVPMLLVPVWYMLLYLSAPASP